MPLVGYVSGAGTTSGARSVEGIPAGAAGTRVLEGKNILVEYRYADGNEKRERDLAARS